MRPRWTVALGVILFGPIALAAWDLRRVDRVAGTPAPAEEARYLSRRSPVIDQLLPGGAGGVRFTKDLEGNAGMAFTRIAAIGLAASVADDPWAGSTELHERAHLVDAFVPELVARLQPDRTFAPWPVQSIREYLAGRRTAALGSHDWLDRLSGHALAPSLAVLSLVDAARRL